MSRAIRPASPSAGPAVAAAIGHLKQARDLLTTAGADKAAARVRAALSSADGARRHVQRRVDMTATHSGV